MIALLLASGPALAELPGPTEDDWKKLQKGDVVTRAAPQLDPPGAYGYVQIAAEPDTIWAVLMDPAEAVKASGSVSSCVSYLDEPTSTGRRIGLHYVLEVAFTEVSYHVLRDFRPAEGTMTWTLDPSKPNDLVLTSGTYTLTPGQAEGTQLLSYMGQVDSGRNIPQWVTNLLTGRALKGYLDRVKTAAEARYEIGEQPMTPDARFWDDLAEDYAAKAYSILHLPYRPLLTVMRWLGKAPPVWILGSVHPRSTAASHAARALPDTAGVPPPETEEEET